MSKGPAAKLRRPYLRALVVDHTHGITDHLFAQKEYLLLLAAAAAATVHTALMAVVVDVLLGY